MRYLIKPRNDDPTSYRKLRLTLLPRWVKVPYKIYSFSTKFVSNLFEANHSGIFKLLFPLAVYHMYDTWNDDKQWIYKLIIFALVGMTTILSMLDRDE